MEIYRCGLWPVICTVKNKIFEILETAPVMLHFLSLTKFTVIGAPVIEVITIYFTITEAEANIAVFNHDSVWEDFQSKLFSVLTCILEIPDSRTDSAKCELQIKYKLYNPGGERL